MKENAVARYGNRIMVRVDADTEAALEAEARKLHTSVSDVIRQAIAEHLATDAAERLQARLGPVVERAISRHVNRLAGLTAKAVRSATAGLYATLAVIQLDGRASPEEVLDAAEQQAVAYLRGRDADEGEGD